MLNGLSRGMVNVFEEHESPYNLMCDCSILSDMRNIIYLAWR